MRVRIRVGVGVGVTGRVRASLLARADLEADEAEAVEHHVLIELLRPRDLVLHVVDVTGEGQGQGWG